MPAEYTMKLERGVTIGGVVVDEAGQPISGAKIQFDDGRGNNAALQENIQFGPDTATFTDADGRWTCNRVPKDLEQVALVITHVEYAETSATIQPRAPEANDSIITMKAGFTIAGNVQDSNGDPIEGAELREVRPNSEEEHLAKTTDASGIFEFQNIKAGELMLAVQAKGFAPVVRTLQVTGSLAAVQFQLGPGHLLRGRVTDEDGNPIAGAWAETTRGRRKIEWSATTDADGRFEWDSAPPEPLLYSFQADGFNRAYALKLQADGSDHQIKLAREQPDKDTIQITGSAVDADTGQPLDGFKVLRSDLAADWAFPFEFCATGKDGRFRVSFPAGSSHATYQLQIEKEGYLPAVSTELLKKAGDQTLEFKMQRGSGPVGVVLLPDGEPAANATVFLCTPRAGVIIDGPAHVDSGLNTTTCRAQTDEAGKFSLPAATDPQGLVVIHHQGYAQLSLSDFEATVTLQAWGRVEGMLILDSQPAANDRVVAYNHVARYSDSGRRFTFMSFHLDTKTDSTGRFVFDKVPPGQCHIFRQTLLSREPRTGFESHETSVGVNPGTVTEVVLGGTGRPITGKALLPGATGLMDWQTVAVQLRLKTADQPASRPKRADFSSNEAYIAAADRFFEAPRQPFGAFCDSDGSFRLPDVPAGTYELEIRVRDAELDSVSPNESLGPPPEIGSLSREIIVPEIPAGQSAEPLDLGILELVPRQHSDSAQ